MAEPGTRGSGWLITFGGFSTRAPSALVRTFKGIDATDEHIMLRAREHVGTDMNSARVAVVPYVPMKLFSDEMLLTGPIEAETS